MSKENEKWRHDTEYISYINSGESAAVFIVRDIVRKVNTNGKWVDVLSFNTYNKRGAEGKWAFNWIIAELFPKKLQPKYCGKDTDYNKYMTWITANEDIRQQREKGYKGDKFLVLCDLQMKNKKHAEPEWEYIIQAVRKVNYRQIEYIQEHEWELENKIRENGRPTLQILGILN